MAIRDKRTDPQELDIWIRADESHGEKGLQMAVVFPESVCGKTPHEAVAEFCQSGYTASSLVPDWLLIDLYDIVAKSNDPHAERIMSRIIDATERRWQE